MEYYSPIKNNDFMKFTGKWMDLENVILSEVTQSQKTTHSLISVYSHSLTHSLISVYSAKSMEYSQYQRVDASVLLRRRNKIIKRSNTLGRKRGKRGAESGMGGDGEDL